MNYARTAQSQQQQQQQQQQQGMYMQTPVISAALLGSGYNLQGQGHQQVARDKSSVLKSQ